MRKLNRSWELRRSFGSQPVESVANPRWTEAGIATQVILSLASRRTFRGKVDTHCRPADLPTCRPADLPTCRIWVLDFSDSSDVSPAFNSEAGNFAASFSSRPRLPSQGRAIVRTSSPVLPRGAIFLNSSFTAGNSEQPNQ
jgi:hypothetical protein